MVVCVMKIKLHPVALSILFAIGLLLSLTFFVPTVPVQEAIIERPDELCENQLHEKSFVRTELLFGLSKPNNGVIAEAEFQHFVDQKVTPLFPDGLTMFSATGQFRDNHEAVVKEGSKLLLLLYPVNPTSHRNVEQIRQAYKTMFQQESVLRVDHRSCVSF